MNIKQIRTLFNSRGRNLTIPEKTQRLRALQQLQVLAWNAPEETRRKIDLVVKLQKASLRVALEDAATDTAR